MTTPPRTTIGLLMPTLLAAAGCAGPTGATAVRPPRPMTSTSFELPGHGTFRVEPFEGEAFGDPQALVRLVETMFARATSTGDRVPYGALLTLEEFFEGNEDAACFGANLGDESPCGSPGEWLEAAWALRSRPDISALYVWNAQLEPYEDGRLANWPYADAWLAVTTLDSDQLTETVGHLMTSDVWEPDRSDWLDSFEAAGVDIPEPPLRVMQIWWD